MVLRHCLRARRLALARDALLVLAMIAAWIAEPMSVAVLPAIFVPMVVIQAQAGRRPSRDRSFLYAVMVVTLFLLIGWAAALTRDALGPGGRA
ncbi:hypothetical protein [Nonomuraea sp. NPDC050643]|uniref:hypothetical protein n=1 Tax=Nonomuraea sp. NPDC050643 TaxID=3155660 RepID=UPI0034038C94